MSKTFENDYYTRYDHPDPRKEETRGAKETSEEGLGLEFAESRRRKDLDTRFEMLMAEIAAANLCRAEREASAERALEVFGVNAFLKALKKVGVRLADRRGGSMKKYHVPDPPQHFKVPEILLPGIRRWVLDAVPPGRFLRAVISNDLREALRSADDESRKYLPDILAYFNLLPKPCYGEGALDTWKGIEEYRSRLTEECASGYLRK